MEKESLADEFDYKSMKVCAVCFRIYGVCIDQENKFLSYYQKCDCVRNKWVPAREIKQEKWYRWDFNEIITLCYCCGQIILRSGSKWSVWFCDDCKKGVIDFHEKYKIWIFPIGRHSLMNRVGLNSVDMQREELVKEFLSNMGKFFSSTDKLRKWHKIGMLNNLRTLGYVGDVLLMDYLIRTRELPPKSQALKGMFKFFEIPDKLIPQSPESPKGRNDTEEEMKKTTNIKCDCEDIKIEMPPIIEEQLTSSPNGFYSWGSKEGKI